MASKLFLSTYAPFFLFATRYCADDLLRLRLEHYRGVSLPPTLRGEEDLVFDFVQALLDNNDRLRSVGFPDRKVCLIIDGDPLPAKRHAHKRREQASKAEFNAVVRIAGQRLDKEKKSKAVCETRIWIRFFPEIKELMEQNLGLLGFREYSPRGAERNSYFFAPLEADPCVVQLARQSSRKSAIYSPDGNLFAYGGSLETLSVLRADYRMDNMPGRITTKALLLEKLGLKKPEDHDHMLV
ncbi:hypothetical protein DFQ29_007083 [Apophysomyces sp. BC1021]|nr:hypothetical protein DFQ29_007083 [Apophysomyces sp. BC1021]